MHSTLMLLAKISPTMLRASTKKCEHIFHSKTPPAPAQTPDSRPAELLFAPLHFLFKDSQTNQQPQRILQMHPRINEPLRIESSINNQALRCLHFKHRGLSPRSSGLASSSNLGAGDCCYDGYFCTAEGWCFTDFNQNRLQYVRF